jgi:sensor domain CHASE-containing protein
MKKENKKGVVSEYLPWVLIALVLLVVVLISIFFLREQGISLIDQIKNLFRRG